MSHSYRKGAKRVRKSQIEAIWIKALLLEGKPSDFDCIKITPHYLSLPQKIRGYHVP
jgi:hypothetical protein